MNDASLHPDSFNREDEADRQEQQLDQLRVALRRLNDLDQAIISMRYFDGMTNRQVAEQLNLTDQAAGMRYNRAMTRLRKRLAALENQDE